MYYYYYTTRTAISISVCPCLSARAFIRSHLAPALAGWMLARKRSRRISAAAAAAAYSYFVRLRPEKAGPDGERGREG